MNGLLHGKTHFGREFDVECVTEVANGLFVGAYSTGPWNILDLRDSELHDTFDPVPSAYIEELANRAEAMWTRHPLLICCTAGINRSPLVAAVLLMRWGDTADEAIAHLRERRGDVVLCNPTFEAWLRERAT